MARMRQCITPAQGLSLVNSLIEQIPIQRDLLAFKKRGSTYGDLEGKVSAGYWRSFRRRNAYLIVGKKGQKYKLDQVTWSTYANVVQMYDNNGNETVEAEIAVEFEIPCWIDH